MTWYNTSAGTWVVSGEFNSSAVLDGSGVWLSNAEGIGNIVITYDVTGAKVFTSGALQFSTAMAPVGEITLADNATLGSVKYYPRAFTDGEAIALATGGVAVDFGIRNLFNTSEQGTWYDPSDLTTLFQDAAGTTPVTAHGQPVGLMLDKSGNGNHASQPTTASRPLYQSVGGLQYLLFDGVDDWLSTASINFTATDKVSVFAGVRKLSDAAAGILLETSVDSGVSAGSFSIIAPSSSGANSYRFTSRSAGVLGIAGTGAFAVAPDLAVLTGSGDISGDRVSLRRNAAQVGIDTADAGPGNYDNYPLYIGRRGGTSAPFNGHLYGLIIRGALTDDPTTIKVEQLLAGKTGVTLP